MEHQTQHGMRWDTELDTEWVTKWCNGLLTSRTMNWKRKGMLNGTPKWNTKSLVSQDINGTPNGQQT